MNHVGKILTVAAAMLSCHTPVNADPLAAPRGLHCRSRDIVAGFSCSWSFGEADGHPDNVTATYSHVSLNEGRELECVLTAGGRGCTAPLVEINSHKPHRVTVQARRGGEVSGHSIRFLLEDIVQPDPPGRLEGFPEPGSPSTLLVNWTAPVTWSNAVAYYLRYRLRYRSLPQRRWKEITVMENEYLEPEYTQLIADAQPGTEHIVQVAASYMELWSDWSEELRVVPWTQATSEVPDLVTSTAPDYEAEDYTPAHEDVDRPALTDNAVIYTVAGLTGVLLLLIVLGSRLLLHRRSRFGINAETSVPLKAPCVREIV